VSGGFANPAPGVVVFGATAKSVSGGRASVVVAHAAQRKSAQMGSRFRTVLSGAERSFAILR
jgi:hypothetical protein